MALIKDIATLKQHINFDANSKIQSILPAIEQAEEQYLLPYLGEEILAALQIALDGGDLTGYDTTLENLTKLLPMAQKSITFYAAVDFIPESEVRFSGSGLHVPVTQSTKPASERQVKNLERIYLKKGDFFTDKLLEFLETNKDVYPDWSNNAVVYTYAKEIFVQDSIEFSKYKDIAKSRRTFMTIRPFIKDAQESYIKPELGEEFYESLLEKFMDGDLSSDETKLLAFIKPAVAHLAFYDAMPMLNFNFEAGTVKLTSFVDNKLNKSAEAMLSEIRQHSFELGLRKIKQLVDFLKENYEKYPLFDYTPEEDDSSQYLVANVKNDFTKKHFIAP